MSTRSPFEQAPIVVEGARTHNLKNVSLSLPRGKRIVLTGPSGSGKSSFAFDTLFAESQRRFVESLSVYAKQFLSGIPKPDVEHISGLSPAIAIEQRPLTRSRRSTVGTASEIADYLRVLFARAGDVFCPNCGVAIEAQTVERIVDTLQSLVVGTKTTVLAPVCRGRKGELRLEIDRLRRDGFVRARIDGVAVDLGEDLVPDKQSAHDMDVVIDRFVIKAGLASRISESVELALKVGDGRFFVENEGTKDPIWFSERYACVTCNLSFPELEPKLFSFNHPQGACETCAGVGETSDVDASKLIGDPSLSLREGVILPWGEKGSVAYALSLAEAHQVFKIDVDAPWSALPERDRTLLLFGPKKSLPSKDVDPSKKAKTPKKVADHPGLLAWVRTRIDELADPKRSNDDDGKEERVQEDGARTREELRGFLSFATCRDCGGARLRREARAVKLAGKNLPELSREPLEELLLHWKESYDLLRPAQRAIAKTAWESVFARLRYLCEVGLGYLSLDRTTDTLSTGEGQRIRLASQLGAGLVGVLYVLDEPGTGLHPKDHEALLRSEKALRDLGNTVVVIDHSRISIRNADWIVEFGPGAGIHGGEVITEGTLSDILSDPRSLSSRFLKVPPTPGVSRPLPAKQQFLTVEGVTRHNLKDVSARFPLGKRTTVVGVSGSGKSTMVLETLLPAGRNATSFTKYEVRCKRVLGLEHIGRVCVVDQEPIGRTARSNPATYSGMFGDLRELFASTPDARARGYKASRFSFNVKGGRCEVCFGEGVRRIEMQFMADVEVGCDACQGARYNRETLDVRYAGRSIADVLRMSVDDVYAAFENIPLIRAKAAAMRNVGLGYLRLGQPAGSLSGGEAQRLRLARELAKKTEGKTLYIFDEPTSGLHFLDVEVLLRTFDELRDRGNTLVVIEHNLDVIASSDWIVELGPGAGKYGGKLVFEGTPGDLLACKESPTAPFLKPSRDK